jgi:hypothetical protein
MSPENEMLANATFSRLKVRVGDAELKSQIGDELNVQVKEVSCGSVPPQLQLDNQGETF